MSGLTALGTTVVVMPIFVGSHVALYVKRRYGALLFLALALGGSLLVSYARAKGELVGVDTAAGLMQRAERLVLLAVASLADAPLVAWQYIAKSDRLGASRWRQLWLAHGYQTVVRVEFSLPAGRAFECFMFSPRELSDRTEAASLAWSALNIWPLVKRSIAQARSTLSPRERECLLLAFEGLTARESSARLSCTERTVNYHLANAMGKLKVDNKMAAIQRACWIGAI
jgi:DNA-binding CsgD family transcriptional regulator